MSPWRPLVWAGEGQFEIARVLFVPEPDAIMASHLYDDIKQFDSRYRNLLTEHNRNARRLRDQKRAQGAAGDTRAAAAAAQAAYEGTVEALNRVDALIDQCIGREREHSDELRRQQLDLEGSFRAYEGIQQQYFAHAFPQADETFHYIMAHIVSEGGCLVCGSDAKGRAHDLKRQIAEGRCPVCDSPPDDQERVVGTSKVAAERVNRSQKELEAKRKAYQSLCDRRDAIAEQIGTMLDERRSLQEVLDTHRLKLAALEARLPASDAAISELEAAVKVGQQRVDELAKNRAEALRAFRNLMKRAGGLIESRHPRIKEHFQECVKAFLEESCELNYRERERIVGQSGEKVRFPGFDIMMTSGTFPDTPTARLSIDDVSESQKEFVDLAFRIALIRTASEGQGAMLVLETPEASLDSLFIYRAGDLLRDFATEGGPQGTVLLASSNLNDARACSQLPGFGLRV